MKKISFNIILVIIVTLMYVENSAYNFTNNATEPERKWATQWNHNPEETNDELLWCYETSLDQGLVTEEGIYNEIIYGNNLTEQGIKDLINDGYLVSYVDEFIAAGRLPEGFTPTPKTETQNNTSTENKGSEAAPAPTEPDSSQNSQEATPQKNNQALQTPQTPAPVTCDDSVAGTYIVTKADTKGYLSYTTSSEVVQTYALGTSVDVKGLTSNGYYKVLSDNKELYIQKKNLVDKGTYDAAWQESGRTESTCQAEGSILYTNAITGETNSWVIEKKEHEMQLKEQIPATCKEDGYELYICANCEEIQETTFPMTEHEKGELKTVTKAGLFSEGLQESRCVACDEVLETQMIPQIIPDAAIIVLFVLVAGVCVFVYIKRKGII